MNLNSCWGHKIAITKDSILRPCIYSGINLGKLDTIKFNQLIDSIKIYWDLTKDHIDKCKDCELRYVCFDCREIARRVYKKIKFNDSL